mmetsp:Transcript_21695/g.54743  ORF Transcript_21695/g.54743 Transcript_21695/m.54743 type:complete len:101 (-) Transcript_21695:21-323(-)
MSDLKDLLAYVCKVHKTILLDVQVPGLPKAGHLLEALTRLRTEPLPHEVADFLRHTWMAISKMLRVELAERGFSRWNGVGSWVRGEDGLYIKSCFSSIGS